jgi:hypothetical protein
MRLYTRYTYIGAAKTGMPGTGHSTALGGTVYLCYHPA